MKRKIITLQSTDSTNNFIKSLSCNNNEMLVVIAQEQTAGRGQGTNSWESIKGKNLLISIMLHPYFLKPDSPFLLSMAASLAIKDTLTNYCSNIKIKWPNDIYWKDYKISGTLIETSIAAAKIKYFVIGIGLNINQTQFYSNAPNPISLKQIVKKDIKKEEVLETLLNNVEKYYILLQNNNEQEIIQQYHESLYRNKGYYKFKDADGYFMAKIIGVASNGKLTLCDIKNIYREYQFKQVSYIL